jgi:hypothetical protein
MEIDEAMDGEMENNFRSGTDGVVSNNFIDLNREECSPE